ncbi:cytidyltransferase [Amycolatopsis sp. K13G38]|uniref:FAD synthase n=1 Tax=Amycolatopsis acididurans TaxID=2724524 RepID=A0ABX1J3Y2_9PSEU|nr:cytidyltransferase [Amycolatopsis acididurans]NKQ54497.1 cytidyltransferase [Amycolatopsis acididurans]
MTAMMLRETPIFLAPQEVPATLGPCVVTLGVFDGVHRGHAHLIERATAAGRERGLPTMLVTFDPHPARVLGLPRDTSALSTVERRAALAGELGVDAVCVLPFTTTFARLSPEDFVADILVGALRAAHVVVGDNFTFGHRGAGNTALLRELGERHGFTVHAQDLLPAEADVACSSTYIRRCLREGDLTGATRALGRPPHLEGDLGAAGAFAIEPGTALPAPGTYLVRLPNRRAARLILGRHGAHLHATGLAPGRIGIDVLARA